MLKNFDILCISSAHWDFLRTRKQKFMEMLSEHNRILYVEPGDSPLSLLLSPEIKKTSGIFPEIEMKNKNLYILRPSFLIPLDGFTQKFNVTLVNRFNQNILAKNVKLGVEKLGFKNMIIWVYFHRALPFKYIMEADSKIIVYDCVDEHSAYPNVNSDYIWNLEKKLIKMSDIVFVTAKGLLEKRKNINQNTYHAPNGVDYELFSMALKRQLPIPEDLKNIKKPIVGFVGALYEWVDIDLMFEIFKNCDYSLVIIGPIGKNIKIDKLQSLKNVHFLGRKNQSELPYYLQHIDCCLNIFKESELSKKVNPLKVYEYLAAGKPVVSTEMPELLDLNVVKIARTPSEFLNAIEYEIKNDTEEKRWNRNKVASEFSWDKILNNMTEKIEKYIKFYEKD